MSTQPLTPRNTHIIIVAKSASVANYALTHYGIPTDPDNVEPTLTRTIITTFAECKTFIDTAPSNLLPWCFIGSATIDNAEAILSSMTTYFGQRRTLSACIDMLNNEYAIDPAKLRAAGA